jgi:hypothetical protein
MGFSQCKTQTSETFSISFSVDVTKVQSASFSTNVFIYVLHSGTTEKRNQARKSSRHPCSKPKIVMVL